MAFNTGVDDSTDETFSRHGGVHEIGDVLSPLKGGTSYRVLVVWRLSDSL